MNLIQPYFAYGEALATTTPAIGHTSQRKRFVKITEAGKADEFIRAAASELPTDGTVLVWEMFTEQPENAARDSYTTVIFGSFFVARKGANPADKLVIYDQTREIAIGLLKKMVEDGMRELLPDPRIKLLFQGTEGESVGPIATSWYGYGFTFSWRVPLF